MHPHDYEVVRLGGTAQRWQALREGKHDATLLSTPYNIIARKAGLTQLVRGIAVLGNYQGNVGAARRSWASANKAAVIGFIRAYADAIDWLYDRANGAEASPDFVPRASGHDRRSCARQAYDELLDPKDGFFRNGRIDMDRRTDRS